MVGVFQISIARANKKICQSEVGTVIIELKVDVINGNLGGEKDRWRNVQIGLNCTVVYYSLWKTKENLYLDLKIYLLYYSKSLCLWKAKLETLLDKRVIVIKSDIIKYTVEIYL